MANKYIRVGAAFNGDGSSSALATSNGGVGAWNTLSVMEGTAPAFGTLVAGDNVFIRSKNESGADIDRTLTASVTLGSTAAVAGNTITWTLDDGTVWPGVSGKLTYLCPASYVVTVGSFNFLLSKVQHNWIIRETNTASNGKAYVFAINGRQQGLLYDFSGVTSSYGSNVVFGNTGTVTLDGVKFITSFRPNSFLYANYSTRVIASGLEIEVNPTTFGATSSLFRIATGATWELYGGSVYGPGINSNTPLVEFAGGQGSNFTGYGFQFPSAMKLVSNTVFPDVASLLSMTGVDGGVGAVGLTQSGQWSSRTDGYFPVLDAQYPTSVPISWSWWLYPNGASPQSPFQIPSTKLYTDTAGVKTLTLEFLVSTSYPALDTKTCYAVFNYVDDATGKTKILSTKEPLANSLPTSTAAWSATTYGPVNLSKHKLSVTTPTAVKKDSLITVSFYVEKSAAIANDIIFMDPDFLIA